MVFETFEQLIQKQKSVPHMLRMAVAAAGDPHTIEAVLHARAEGIASPVLVGDRAAIDRALKELGGEVPESDIYDVPDLAESARAAVSLVRDGKAKGIRVSGEVCPHHFTLTDADIVPGDSNYKMNPPLRTRADVEALREGLREGIMDAISTDHAPHTAEEKARDLTKAPFGIVGMETAAALTYTELVLGGYLTPCQMAEKMSANPARILGIDKGDISPGKTADVVVFDPRVSYEIHGADFAGKAKNMPYEGRKVTGQVAVTICGGKVTYRRKTND